MKKALFLMMCLCFSISVLAQAKTVTGTVVMLSENRLSEQVFWKWAQQTVQ